jgi:hypothetical protein
LIFEHLHTAGCLLEVFQRRDDPLSRVLWTNEDQSKGKKWAKKEVWSARNTKHTLIVGILYCGVLFIFLDKTKLVPPSLDVLFGGRVSRKLLMMNHVVGGGRRKRLVLVVVVVMLRGTVEAYKSFDLCSEARLDWLWRGERQIEWMSPCEQADPDLRSIMHSHIESITPLFLVPCLRFAAIRSVGTTYLRTGSIESMKIILGPWMLVMGIAFPSDGEIW